MVALIFNEVLRIDAPDLQGFFRVIATPAGNATVWLAYIGPWADSAEEFTEVCSSVAVGSLSHVARETLWAMERDGRLAAVVLRTVGKLLSTSEDLDEEEKSVWKRRLQQMTPFLDHEVLADSLVRTSGIGPVVKLALAAGDGTRSTVYRLWQVLCQNGFEASSLHPRFDRCGAPGAIRPNREGQKKVGPKTLRERLGEPDMHPQRPSNESDRVKILQHARILSKAGLPFVELYDQIIQRVYVNRYERTEDGQRGIAPPQGSFPNKRQVRHIIESGIKRLERVLRATTQGHYQRNLRGLRGKARDGVAGPGHAYAIDATVGDIHLRSSVNRAWFIGRPIVYMVVDIWSTAIVGFYVCLSGPSWNTAKLAVFSTCCDPQLLAELWGFEYIPVLNPAPTAPFQVWTDRGEYVSAGARETCLSLGINFAIDPPYRPDMKGLVEVLHRIAKDRQYNFLPGAINFRRKELENKPSAKQSALTLREYVHYLHGVFCHYNLFSDRSKQLTMEMIGAGVEASPAGLWRFGHEAGIGYRKAISQDRLITGLLKRGTAVARRDGIFLESLQYESAFATSQDWTGQARNFGVIEKTVFSFPGSTSRFWCPDTQEGLQEFSLRTTARASGEVSMDEWRDVLMFDRLQKDDREYRRFEAALKNMESNSLLRKQALVLTAEADAAYVGPKPNTREARLLETVSRVGPMPKPSDGAEPLNEFTDASAVSNVAYEALMDEVFSSMNRQAAP
ncbi:DDE-type integrase/transposase/recombinase [Hydrogenophaga sp. PAMC20947]|uniref:DDE-type integrase/transposase/recombinase n=1 Tax=Hydrogenophaga sp. PAMC20947 TaxID=2565558 RepID=UPI001446FAB8|nr:DDE-type integrase/transposase/recombinase [Hydrogenophaga sp. PAMC20947]